MKRIVAAIIMGACLIASGCISTLWTGASMVYDRHSLFKQANDYDLALQARKIVYSREGLHCTLCAVDITAFQGDLLVAGLAPNHETKIEMHKRLQAIEGYRSLFFHVAVGQPSASNPYLDSWITTKIRTAIFADDGIDPDTLKVITVDRIVYLLGEIKKDQGEKVIAISTHTEGVERVVQLFHYYQIVSTNQSNRQ